MDVSSVDILGNVPTLDEWNANEARSGPKLCVSNLRRLMQRGGAPFFGSSRAATLTGDAGSVERKDHPP